MYFREHYAAYSSVEEVLLVSLAKRLRRGIYEPHSATKIFFPKASGILRPYSLIVVEDQIVYQAAANVIADAMLPRVRARYLREVFGHLYAGRASPWFYRKWSDGYRRFNSAAIDAFSRGLRVTAGFDLTACYDSIDHGVLCHFLKQLGFDLEFGKLLSNWLSTWTATDTQIRHNHGIPQGPLSSGLVAEVVLGHFDDHRQLEKAVRYLRYVDDIRLFARRERELRQMLNRLDRLSKDIGLFPQSGKIEIHEVKNIRDELKSVSYPGERFSGNRSLSQVGVRKRLRALTKRFNVQDPTRFKFVLGSASPSVEVTRRVLRVYERAPIYYDAVSRYLSRYEELPVALVEWLLDQIRAQNLYPAIQAAFVRVLSDRVPAKLHTRTRKALKGLWSPKGLQADLAGAIVRYLVPRNGLTESQVRYAAVRVRSWWVRGEIGFALSGAETITSRGAVLNTMVCDPVGDVAVAAAWVAGQTGIPITARRRDLSPGAKFVLREFGLVKRGGRRVCGINASLAKMANVVVDVDWRKFFAGNYRPAERQMVECRGYAETNASAWVNGMDVFNDWLLIALYRHDSTLGTYVAGSIGSLMGSTRLAAAYPAVPTLIRGVHEKRYSSSLSHAMAKRSGKATRPIRFGYLRTGKRLLRAGAIEIGRKF
jgi:Reverse transcriptase (RNA-dependent DNA polymerase)